MRHVYVYMCVKQKHLSRCCRVDILSKLRIFELKSWPRLSAKVKMVLLCNGFNVCLFFLGGGALLVFAKQLSLFGLHFGAGCVASRLSICCLGVVSLSTLPSCFLAFLVSFFAALSGECQRWAVFVYTLAGGAFAISTFIVCLPENTDFKWVLGFHQTFGWGPSCTQLVFMSRRGRRRW